MIRIGEKLMNMFNFNYDDDYDDDYDDNFEDEVEEDTRTYKKERPVRNTSTERISHSEPAAPKQKSVRQPRTSTSKVVPLKSNKTAYNNGMSVQVIKPIKFEECRDIVDILLRGKSVILNVEGMNVETAQKIIDFVSGATYSIQGNLQMITNYIIIVTPYGVDLSGDFNELMNGGFDSSTFNSNY